MHHSTIASRYYCVIAPYHCRQISLTALEVVEEDGKLLSFLAKVTDNSDRAVDDLLRDAVLVDFAQTGPFAELLAIGDFDEGDVVLGAEGLNQTDVVLFVAAFGQDTQVGVFAVEGFDGFTETAGEPVVAQRGA